MRAVVNVSFGEKFERKFQRLEKILSEQGETLLSWNSLPPGSPTHEQTPFAFKGFALQEAANQGIETLLWCDSSIIPIQLLSSLWELIETQGYWFSENFPHGSVRGPWTNGQWTNDSSLIPLGITRQESFTFPHVVGTAFGLDLHHEVARTFLSEYLRLAKEGTSFHGGLSNLDGRQSKDKRVLGHRHDQTAASVLAWKLGMKLTRPPSWIVDGIPPTEETVLKIQRWINLSKEEVSSITQSVLSYTMMDELRVQQIIRETERTIWERIPGAVVECGVWRGGAMMAAAKTILSLDCGCKELKDLYLFDTYNGMPAPDPVDVDLHGRSALDPSTGSYDAAGCTVDLASVQSAMNSTEYNPSHLHYVAGKVEDTLPSQAPEQIALLHLDTDWYSSTRHELEQLFPRVSPGGCVIVDDYQHWQGCKLAVDEYLAAYAPDIHPEPHGYTAVALRKPPR